MEENKLKYECGMIQDLLPLYQDDACSGSSKKAVEEHLKECANCKTVSEKLKNMTYDAELVGERNSVIGAYEKKERRRSATIGIVTAGVLMIPVIICLICNLAIGHALDWFFIVLASMLIVASLTVVPLVVPEKRGLWTLASFTGSLVLLLLVTCIFVRGNWFFLAAIPVIFGLSVAFLPFVMYQIPLPEVCKDKKGLLVMLWDTTWLLAIIIVCGIHSSYSRYWQVALPILGFCLILPWAMFLCIRYTKWNPFTKAGVMALLIGGFVAIANDVITWIVDGQLTIQMLRVNLLNWNLNNIDANSNFITSVGCVIAGIIFIVIGSNLKKKSDIEAK